MLNIDSRITLTFKSNFSKVSSVSHIVLQTCSYQRADFWEIVPGIQSWILIRALLWPLNQISQKSTLSVRLYCKLLSGLTFEKLLQGAQYRFAHHLDLWYLAATMDVAPCCSSTPSRRASHQSAGISQKPAQLSFYHVNLVASLFWRTFGEIGLSL